MKILISSNSYNTGKTYLANRLIKEHSYFKLLNFSDPLKCELADLITNKKTLLRHNLINAVGLSKTKKALATIPREVYFNNSKKYKSMSNDARKEYHFKSMHGLPGFGKKSDYRLLMQYYGTNFRRNEDPGYWSKQLFNYVQEHSLNDVIIPDCRFENELKLFPDTLSIYLTNPYAVNKDNHASESISPDLFDVNIVWYPDMPKKQTEFALSMLSYLIEQKVTYFRHNVSVKEN